MSAKWYAIEYLWKDKNKRKIVEFDASTGEAKFEDGVIMKQVTNLVVKLGRMAAKKAIH